MVSNATNINKTTNHLSPYLTEHNKPKPWHDIGSLYPSLDRYKHFNGIPPPLDNWISSFNT